MSESGLKQRFQQQRLANGFELVNGVRMHGELGERFQIPHRTFRHYCGVGHFVELRIDSPRFSAHPDAPVNCTCPHCNEPAAKPILSHEQPASLVHVPRQNVPSRGWGEEFWVRVVEREAEHLRGIVDNPLYESRLHGLADDDEICFHEDHILAVHAIHNQQIIVSMSEADLREFREWVQSQPG